MAVCFQLYWTSYHLVVFKVKWNLILTFRFSFLFCLSGETGLIDNLYLPEMGAFCCQGHFGLEFAYEHKSNINVPRLIISGFLPFVKCKGRIKFIKARFWVKKLHPFQIITDEVYIIEESEAKIQSSAICLQLHVQISEKRYTEEGTKALYMQVIIH